MVIKTSQLITYIANVAVYSDIHTKHSTLSKHHVEILNVKPRGTLKKTLGFKRLMAYLREGLNTWILYVST
jgi:hypothetical protein